MTRIFSPDLFLPEGTSLAAVFLTIPPQSLFAPAPKEESPRQQQFLPIAEYDYSFRGYVQ